MLVMICLLIIVGYLKLKSIMFFCGSDDLGTSKSNSELYWEEHPEDFV